MAERCKEAIVAGMLVRSEKALENQIPRFRCLRERRSESRTSELPNLMPEFIFYSKFL
jgi:hypothetical protein